MTGPTGSGQSGPGRNSAPGTQWSVFSFRPLRRADFDLLVVWMNREHVARWWSPHRDLASLETHYGPAIDRTEPTEYFIAGAQGVPLGMVQRYRIDDHPEWSSALRKAGQVDAGAGIDYLIGEPDLVGQGIGPRMISAFVESTWGRYPDLQRITVAVQQANRRSWRALEKSGFRRVFAGMVDSDDPSDAGPSFLYVEDRPTGTDGAIQA